MAVPCQCGLQLRGNVNQFYLLFDATLEREPFHGFPESL